jgi:hypothetical protein
MYIFQTEISVLNGIDEAWMLLCTCSRWVVLSHCIFPNLNRYHSSKCLMLANMCTFINNFIFSVFRATIFPSILISIYMDNCCFSSAVFRRWVLVCGGQQMYLWIVAMWSRRRLLRVWGWSWLCLPHYASTHDKLVTIFWLPILYVYTGCYLQLNVNPNSSIALKTTNASLVNGSAIITLTAPMGQMNLVVSC